MNKPLKHTKLIIIKQNIWNVNRRINIDMWGPRWAEETSSDMNYHMNTSPFKGEIFLTVKCMMT